MVSESQFASCLDIWCLVISIAHSVLPISLPRFRHTCPDTIETFRISLHNFMLGQVNCEMISRVLAQTQMNLQNFVRTFLHNFHCDLVVACGCVAVFIQESAKREIVSQLSFTTHSSFHRNFVWELFCEKCCAVFTAHFTEKCLGNES